jgi:hypothetical protein
MVAITTNLSYYKPSIVTEDPSNLKHIPTTVLSAGAAATRVVVLEFVGAKNWTKTTAPAFGAMLELFIV